MGQHISTQSDINQIVPILVNLCSLLVTVLSGCPPHFHDAWISTLVPWQFISLFLTSCCYQLHSIKVCCLFRELHPNKHSSTSRFGPLRKNDKIVQFFELTEHFTRAAGRYFYCVFVPGLWEPGPNHPGY